MNDRPIDVWGIETFDDALLSELREAADLISGYIETDQQQFLAREASQHRLAHAKNPYAQNYHAFLEGLIPLMSQRSIRAWHYTRLTNDEVQSFIAEGPVLSDLTGVRRRIDAQVAAGTIPLGAADRLWAGSPFHRQEDIRSRRFWATSNPIPNDDGGVELLLGHWGGESVYFWQEDTGLVSLLRGIGTARIFELEVPLRATNRAFNAVFSVVAAFAKSIGCTVEDRGFDVCVTQPLGPQSILAVHSAGDEKFETVGRSYPALFSLIAAQP